MTSYEALWVPWWYGLRVCDPSSKKVFSIHSVLKVASQNRIFASGVYRQFPAPDFNRLVAMLPRHTVRSLTLLFGLLMVAGILKKRPMLADIATNDFLSR